MSSKTDEIAADHMMRDYLEIELCSIKGLIETAHAAVTNPNVSRQAICSTLEVAATSVDNVKTLFFGPTPT